MSATVYRIGEAAKLLNLKTYVLRFWETEFPQLVPDRAESGQRLYTEAHIELLQRIRHMLYEQGLTIEGARKVLGEGEQAEPLLLSEPQAAPLTSSIAESTIPPETAPPAGRSVETAVLRYTIDELEVLRAMLHEVGAATTGKLS